MSAVFDTKTQTSESIDNVLLACRGVSKLVDCGANVVQKYLDEIPCASIVEGDDETDADDDASSIASVSTDGSDVETYTAMTAEHEVEDVDFASMKEAFASGKYAGAFAVLAAMGNRNRGDSRVMSASRETFAQRMVNGLHEKYRRCVLLIDAVGNDWTREVQNARHELCNVLAGIYTVGEIANFEEASPQDFHRIVRQFALAMEDEYPAMHMLKAAGMPDDEGMTSAQYIANELSRSDHQEETITRVLSRLMKEGRLSED